jgi:hypothetical protein
MVTNTRTAAVRIWMYAAIFGMADLAFTAYVLVIDHAALETRLDSYAHLVNFWSAMHPTVNFLVDVLGRNFWHANANDWWLRFILLILCFLQGSFFGALIGWAISRTKKSKVSAPH